MDKQEQMKLVGFLVALGGAVVYAANSDDAEHRDKCWHMANDMALQLGFGELTPGYSDEIAAAFWNAAQQQLNPPCPPPTNPEEVGPSDPMLGLDTVTRLQELLLRTVKFLGDAWITKPSERECEQMYRLLANDAQQNLRKLRGVVMGLATAARRRNG